MAYEKIIIIGSDMYDLSKTDLENAFSCLERNDFVLGPAEDGGYYLLGMKKNKPEIFQNKKWGTKTVFSDTINDLKNEKVYLLPIKNDIDIYEDIEGLEIFKQYLK